MFRVFLSLSFLSILIESTDSDPAIDRVLKSCDPSAEKKKSFPFYLYFLYLFTHQLVFILPFPIILRVGIEVKVAHAWLWW